MSPLARPEKEAVVEELKANIEGSTIAIATQYKGITVEEVTELRAQLREADVIYKVYKNTLAKRALDDLGLPEVAEYMEGPIAWAFCADPVTPAKLLKLFSKNVEAIVRKSVV